MSACGLLGYMQTLLDDLILEARASPRAFSDILILQVSNESVDIVTLLRDT